jgi:hypothetical protein
MPTDSFTLLVVILFMNVTTMTERPVTIESPGTVR